MGLFDFLKKQSAPAKPAGIEVAAEKGVVYAPASGRVEPMESLPDPVFAGGAMGPALGVWPEEGKVYAPVSGTISVAMPHAYGIAGDDGVEILVHVGVDTVEMAGDGFDVKVSKGQQVKAGDVLLEFNRDKVAAAGHPDVVITVVTSGQGVVSAAEGQVAAGTPLITLA